MTEKILCYGDSNTFGFNPETFKRYNEKFRWSGILKNDLKEHYEIIEEGLNNRTGFISNNPNGIEYCTIKHLPIILEKYKNIKILILSVGTNDFQFHHNTDKEKTEIELKKIINLIKEKNIEIIIIPPVLINEKILKGMFSSYFDKNSIQKSKDIFPVYEKISKEFNCKYFDINNFTSPSNIDGLHYDEKSHKLIAQNLSSFIIKNYKS